MHRWAAITSSNALAWIGSVCGVAINVGTCRFMKQALPRDGDGLTFDTHQQGGSAQLQVRLRFCSISQSITAAVPSLCPDPLLWCASGHI